MSEQWITNRRRAQSRLPRLARWLREVSQLVNGAAFYLNTFTSTYIYDPHFSTIPEPGVPRNAQEASRCGFKGCALGWATLEPRFRKAGLRLTDEIRWGGFPAALVTAGKFFGISLQAAACIFGTSHTDWRCGHPVDTEDLDPEDPIAAAERVERFCADNGIALEGGAS